MVSGWIPTFDYFWWLWRSGIIQEPQFSLSGSIYLMPTFSSSISQKNEPYPITTTLVFVEHVWTWQNSTFHVFHVFFVWILRCPAWRKATRHTLNRAQLTANKGRARTLLQRTTTEIVTWWLWAFLSNLISSNLCHLCRRRTLSSQDVSSIFYWYLCRLKYLRFFWEICMAMCKPSLAFCTLNLSLVQ